MSTYCRAASLVLTRFLLFRLFPKALHSSRIHRSLGRLSSVLFVSFAGIFDRSCYDSIWSPKVHVDGNNARLGEFRLHVGANSTTSQMNMHRLAYCLTSIGNRMPSEAPAEVVCTGRGCSRCVILGSAISVSRRRDHTKIYSAALTAAAPLAMRSARLTKVFRRSN